MPLKCEVTVKREGAYCNGYEQCFLQLHDMIKIDFLIK